MRACVPQRYQPGQGNQALLNKLRPDSDGQQKETWWGRAEEQGSTWAHMHPSPSAQGPRRNLGTSTGCVAPQGCPQGWDSCSKAGLRFNPAGPSGCSRQEPGGLWPCPSPGGAEAPAASPSAQAQGGSPGPLSRVLPGLRVGAGRAQSRPAAARGAPVLVEPGGGLPGSTAAAPAGSAGTGASCGEALAGTGRRLGGDQAAFARGAPRGTEPTGGNRLPFPTWGGAHRQRALPRDPAAAAGGQLLFP